MLAVERKALRASVIAVCASELQAPSTRLGRMLLQYVRRSTKLAATSHRFSTSSTSSLTPSHSIYVSNSTNPYFNLSLEDWFVRHSAVSENWILNITIGCSDINHIRTRSCCCTEMRRASS